MVASLQQHFFVQRPAVTVLSINDNTVYKHIGMKSNVHYGHAIRRSGRRRKAISNEGLHSYETSPG